MRVSRCGSGLLDRQRDLLDDLAVLVHLDDPPVAALGDHRDAVGEPLEGVDLDAALVLLRLGLVLPDDFLCGVISSTVAGPVCRSKLPLSSIQSHGAGELERDLQMTFPLASTMAACSLSQPRT